MHFTPTSGSWLNMVEIFFGIITRQAIRRGTFTSVKDLIAAIERLHRRLERPLPAFHLDQDRRRHPGQSDRRSKNFIHATLGDDRGSTTYSDIRISLACDNPAQSDVVRRSWHAWKEKV